MHVVLPMLIVFIVCPGWGANPESFSSFPFIFSHFTAELQLDFTA